MVIRFTIAVLLVDGRVCVTKSRGWWISGLSKRIPAANKQSFSLVQCYLSFCYLERDSLVPDLI